MNLEVLDGIVRDAARNVLAARGLPLPARCPDAAVRRPRRPGHGDYATSIALRHASKAGVEPREFAGWLADELTGRPGIASAEVAGPGFVNVRLAAAAQDGVLREIGDAGRRFGTGDDLAASTVRLGARPEGPMPLAEGRRMVLDDARERLLTARGARVERGGGAAEPVARTLVVGARGCTLPGLVDTFGEDAARYALLRDPARVPLEIDPAVLGRRTDVNPVFVVQYAHAHLAATARNAADLGVAPGDVYGLLGHSREGDLIRTLGEFPEVVRAAAELREPHRVARYLEALAGAYHRFYDSCRVLPMGDEPVTDLHRVRLALCVAARSVFANGLGLLGVSAPERM